MHYHKKTVFTLSTVKYLFFGMEKGTGLADPLSKVFYGI